ncbi:cobalt-precorrin-6A reductase [uncultured Roseovarius sp.]|uniref:cobalt-precorrin-6A reductase n=1 Tax=uncultured Roseovarius sp. TaxID=293344 RepID=UPI0026172B5D|nr:cobalt-precorrin-6A reductase [uncultured Roseovarius sp.]
MTLLLLAGTHEAQQIAERLADAGHAAIASLAGATQSPRPMRVPSRVGGFGGDTGFARFLDEAGITAVLDATHPFAARMSDRAARLSVAQGVPYCQILRPGWRPGPSDRWTMIARAEEAAAHIPTGATVFLATGRQGLMGFSNLRGRRLICRVIDPPDAPFPLDNGEFLVGRPPFSADAEYALFKRLNIDWLVVKNAGGRASEAKLDAARGLGLPVAMIERPPQPDAMRVTTVSEAMEWVRSL